MRHPIREAQHEDIPALLDMAQRFHARAFVRIPLCLDTLTAALAGLIDNPQGVVLMAGETAAAGALLHPSWMNRDHLTGSELFWWAEDGGGMGLLEALEAWAAAQGADSFGMVALETMRPDAVGALYRRKGYEPSERSYLRMF